MTLLQEFDTPQQAYIVSGMLEANGIENSVSQSVMSSVFPAPDSGTGVSAIYVEKKDLERARQLLRAHHDK